MNIFAYITQNSVLFLLQLSKSPLKVILRDAGEELDWHFCDRDFYGSQTKEQGLIPVLPWWEKFGFHELKTILGLGGFHLMGRVWPEAQCRYSVCTKNLKYDEIGFWVPDSTGSVGMLRLMWAFEMLRKSWSSMS